MRPTAPSEGPPGPVACSSSSSFTHALCRRSQRCSSCKLASPTISARRARLSPQPAALSCSTEKVEFGKVLGVVVRLACCRLLNQAPRPAAGNAAECSNLQSGCAVEHGHQYPPAQSERPSRISYTWCNACSCKLGLSSTRHNTLSCCNRLDAGYAAGLLGQMSRFPYVRRPV